MSIKFLGSMVLTVCTLVMSANISFAGDSRGGGNAFPVNLVSKGEIEDSIRGVKPMLVIFFKSEKWLADSRNHSSKDLIGRTFDKLFNSPVNSTVKHTVLDEIAKFEFDIRQTGPCRDLDGKEFEMYLILDPHLSAYEQCRP